MIKALITDLDGTILPHGGNISFETHRALEEAGKKGMTRIIATGRNLFAARKVIPENLPIDYLIFSSGAGMMKWDDRRMLFSKHLNRQETRQLASYLWNYNINFMIQKEIPNNHNFYYTDIYPLHEDYKHRLENYASFGTCIDSAEEINTEATQLIMILDPRQIHLVERIRKDLSSYSVIRSTSPTDNRAIWLEIFPAGVNKGTACQDLLDLLAINTSESAGIGNDYNDVDFLDICHQSYLVANAPTRLKPHYKTVAKDIDNGFAEFISLITKEL